jgi:hypothetical protein
MIKEVDAMVMAEFLEDSEIQLKEQETENESAVGFAGFAKLTEKNLYTLEKEIHQSKTSQDLNGIPPFKSSEKKNTVSGLDGIKSTITENPILSLLAGAVLVGGAIMLYKHLSKKNEKKEDFTRDRLKRKRKPELRRLSAEAKIADENSPEVEAKNEFSEKPEKEEIITGKTLGMAIAATVAGSIAGAALGDYSLITAIPLSILGIKKINTNLTMMAAGMALANGYKSKDSDGNFIERALERVKQFFVNIFDKLFFFKKEEQKVPEGYYCTMLGLIPIST